MWLPQVLTSLYFLLSYNAKKTRVFELVHYHFYFTMIIFVLVLEYQKAKVALVLKSEWFSKLFPTPCIEL
jgi:TRAP-type uncharacterized transport system fused permease subunit